MAEPRRTAAEEKAATEKLAADKATADRAQLEAEFSEKLSAAKAELEAKYAENAHSDARQEDESPSVAGVERTVKVGLMTYIDAAGGYRTAKVGDVVEVHPGKVERFDRLNRLQK